ncbi:MAG: DUF2267 domain-containing protein [Candidatus Binataceae bacterium]
MFEGEVHNMSDKNGFLKELQVRLPELNDTEALGWASAAVKHLAQYLDHGKREELAKYLPSSLVQVANEATRVADLFGKEKPGDFFVMATRDAGAPPAKEGARYTLVTVLAAIRKRMPDQPAKEIEGDLPSEVAELWGGEPVAG